MAEQHPARAATTGARGRGFARPRWVVLAALVCLVGALVASGCGGEGEGAEERPTSVTAADLQKGGEFWNSLTPDLKDELVDFAKDRLAQDRGSSVLSLDNNELVAEIDREYTNEAKRARDIYGTYVAANNALAEDNFDDAISQLDQLDQDALEEEELQGDVQAEIEDFITEDVDQQNEEDGFPERVSDVGCVPEGDTTYRCLVEFDDGRETSGQATYDPETGDILYELGP